MVVRRADPPIGKLCFPGGSLEHGEFWQDGAAREVLEESGVTIRSSDLREFMIRSPPDGSFMLCIFALYCGTPFASEADLPPFEPLTPDEVTERLIVCEPPPREHMAFETQDCVIREYFARKAKGTLF